MKDFESIRAVNLEANAALAIRIETVRAERLLARWRRLQHLNNAAYFVLLFAQLEDRINARALRLIQRKRGQASWLARRVWDSLPNRIEDIRRMGFKDRVALLTDRSQHVYRDIMGYYDIRNRIAHGDTSIYGLNINAVVEDLRRFARELLV